MTPRDFQLIGELFQFVVYSLFDLVVGLVRALRRTPKSGDKAPLNL